MNQLINWQQFGLRANPYDTSALVEGGELSIKQAFVGREKESQFIDNIFESENRSCVAICGETGVGKTSFMNFQKYIWKYEQQKLLFSFRREIEASDELLNKRAFIIEILGSVVREIKLLEPALLKNDLLQNIQSILDVSQSLTISGGISGSFQGYGGGINVGRSKDILQPNQLSISLLEDYFVRLIQFLKENKIQDYTYSGLVVHVNNFDVVLADQGKIEKVVHFFNEVRDLLQMRDVYFVFLGPPSFFKTVISKHQRVRSIFIQNPLMMSPLTKTEVIKAFDQRMRLLQSDGVSDFIKPIEDEVVYKLYELYEGDIRSIMSSIRDVISGYSERVVSSPLSLHESMALLGQVRWERLEQTTPLKRAQKKVLEFLVKNEEWISQAEVAKLLNKPQSNISGYYFKPLKEAGIIEEKARKGKKVYWGLTSLYMPLKWVFESQANVQKEVKNLVEKQPSLFE